MNDTTELIQALAQQVVTVVKQSLSTVADPQATTSLAWIETALRDVLRQIGAEALGQWLSSAQCTPEAERPCECGGTLRYQRYRPATCYVWARDVCAYCGLCVWAGPCAADEQYGCAWPRERRSELLPGGRNWRLT
jgi:hypothetical protein